MATEKKKIGRPSDYMPEVAEDICKLLMQGESLRAICKRQGMPHIATVMAWLHRHEEFNEQYARAREIQAEILAEDVMNIADSAIEDGAAVAKAKLQVDARKWYTAKVAPRRYGDRIQHEQKITITDLTDDELDRRLQELTNAQSGSGAED
ncbi:ubiquitin carboxyl-hydrolase [Pectobacterium parmentieri]|uniref:terminase small subunit-like protein n=1 Tax=Pectobacterium parmentieri TaxID=1905730 RepID=UPI000D619346|nr:ubiquitin carboxyl-hydrolase [Pectobacterium parmentieri]AYH33237.1 ubiquitin carboxyl-hydrolase [Pectobacterium parmentieri]MBI0520850.1 ubiquitin carboxyl-hydrolase [Pectobacterium parmentieri]PWD58536.1 ubiquitin carboxyl-hydrolase [Pectobacterium parmentieri]